MDVLQQFAPMLLIFVVFYFLMIRPQISKQKKERTFQQNLKQGMKVVTTAGIHGRVFSIEEDSVIIETLSGRLKLELAAISRELTLSRYPENKE
ncbi:MAG: preprotein translocase subunit YajC [Flavobacteriaceae bacterium]|nr:preprotein translocase subunit YajC [Flavobacteriaceae bacterium]